MTRFVMMPPDPAWHCRIGRIRLKPGATMVCLFGCGSDY